MIMETAFVILAMLKEMLLCVLGVVAIWFLISYRNRRVSYLISNLEDTAEDTPEFVYPYHARRLLASVAEKVESETGVKMRKPLLEISVVETVSSAIQAKDFSFVKTFILQVVSSSVQPAPAELVESCVELFMSTNRDICYSGEPM